MCAIAGIFSLGGLRTDPFALKRMCDIQAHRGPDDAGYFFARPGGEWASFCDPGFAHSNKSLPVFGGSRFQEKIAGEGFQVCLGHRRLSILDTSAAGRQPMASPDLRYWIVYNGEIYNFRELRGGLKSKGHEFRGGSDTEVLLRLWGEHGQDCLPLLNGMFALAVYDLRLHTLTLARDRFGVKPLYYAFTGDHFFFASEIKAILASKQVLPAIHASALVEYFAFQNLFSRETLFRDIHLLLPGECLTISQDSSRAAPARFVQDLASTQPAVARDEDLSARVSDTFSRAVSRQLVSDVEIGAYLSGGMDSGSIVAVAGRALGRLMTFTGGFDLTNVNGIEQGFDERALAERLSYLLQTEHYAVVLHAGDMPAAMERITWHMDDPRVGMCHQNWYVAKLASRFVKVCLSGTGGDELFGGYPWRYKLAADASSVEEFDRKYFEYWHRLLPRQELPRLFSPDLAPHLARPAQAFVSVMAGAPRGQKEWSITENLFQRAFYFEFKTFLHGLFIAEDRISMAHGLETRVPFLDNDLVELAMSLPPGRKVGQEALRKHVRNENSGSNVGKLILREAMGKFLPVEFTRQPKQGFSPPDENWYRGPSMDYIKSILLDRRTLERAWFDGQYVRDKLNQHFTGRENYRLLIWSLLSFEMLQRHYIDC